ncbi:WD repeat- and FYVE domain-containing protein 4-like isoform X2 [Myxocyprinus asiaticus]|uniref:WD repeat- and FYVE domain-containing protein 4-like isoform X2 n=1 Tax=Myxocyprinus asiaticus TaxID=70543 RepID=UPI002223CBC5|nr:WD repeat- and FYVE domain-containing protein 4-like isoform X2 [Myxocyprinus asiaticus]
MPPTKQQAGGEMESINKENGELSSSGESSESVELKTGQIHSETNGNLKADGDAVMVLRDELSQLSTITQLSPEQRDQEINRLLPLFIQVSETGSIHDDLDLQGLALLVGEAFVWHVYQRVAEKPAEEARFELEQFFQRSEVNNSTGWLLLKSLSLLSNGDAEVSAMIKTSLPAALVKCLYLFVALPPREKSSDSPEDVKKEVKCSFQDTLIQVILQLCRQVCFVEVLLETQELSNVIISLTLLWDQCSPSWRRQASCVLRAMSAAQAHNTVSALQASNCMKICIQNMQKISEQVPGHVLAEVVVSVFSFVKDSYSMNPALFEEFENNDGYGILQAVLSRCEEEVTEEHFLAVQDLLDLIASFTLFGKAELKVAICVNNPQPPSFRFDPALTKGSLVKNLTAFKIIQSSFLRSSNTVICSQILHTIQMIWSWEKANFFLLEWTLQSLAQLAECVWQKSPPVHLIFFELLETIVFQLSYIPHETLRKVQAVLKQGCSEAFSVAALDCFYRLIMNSELLSEVLSDGGLMNQLLFELKRRAKIIRKAGVAVNEYEEKADDYEMKLTTNILNVVAALALQSVRNTVFIRDLGMIPYVKIFLDVEQFRSPTLCILEQLSEVNPEEYMSTAIGALCSSTESELTLKLDLLKSIMKVLENPNSWNAFRTAGGFNGLLSIVVDMEGSLLQQPVGVWASLCRQSLVELLLLTLHTIALAVHVHPVNSHFFHTSGVCEKLDEALHKLGCFQGGVPLETDKDSSLCRSFQQFVEMVERPEPQLPPPLGDCVKLLGFLEQFATGLSLAADPCAGIQDRTEAGESQTAVSGQRAGEPSDADETLRHTRGSVSVSTESGRVYCDLTILHPGAIKLIMTLLPSIYCPSDPHLSKELQLAVAYHVQSLVKSERNRQIMCEFGLLSTLLTHCKHILIDNSHSLHLPIVRILEKLASQSMDHKCLRQFLCLGDPLMCSGENQLPVSCEEASGTNQTKDSEEDVRKSSKKQMKRSFSLLKTSSGSGTVVPLHRIISLVSITSPRSFQPHKVSVSPSFVEFDMTDSGFGCLILPSLATVKGVSADFISTGGLGTGCRGFPPSAGLSFSCWFMICRFSSSFDSHPVRLFTVVRHMSRAEQQFSCLSVSISDGCLVISTEEETYQFLDMMEPEVLTPSTLPASVRFKCSKQLIPGQWHHLCLVMAKGIKKSCLVTAYLNGTAAGTAKIKYIQPFPGQCISMDPSAVIDIYGIIGTPSLWKQHAALVWRVGPTYLFEEVLSSNQVEIIYGQGTKYIGNFLALNFLGGETEDERSQIRIVSPERISFAINTVVSTITTVADIRDQYNEVDSRLIAKEMGITSRDNCTPVLLAHNLCQHLSGTARTIGAALVGCFGVRTFRPYSAGSSFQYIGGPAAILSLVAMASDDGSLYAAVKVLLSVLETNPVMEKEMKRTNGYKLLSFLLKMKSQLISSRIFQLILAIVGTAEMGSATVHIPNISAFQDILCDFEVWQNAPENLDLCVLNHFVNVLKSSSGSQQNAEVMHRLNMMSKLFTLLHDTSVTQRKVLDICTIIRSLLEEHFNTTDIKRIGLFLVHTLLPPNLNENATFTDLDFDDQSQGWSQTPGRSVWIRNQLLSMLSSLIISGPPLFSKKQEEVFFALGSDWFLLFLQGHIHTSTVLLVLTLLTHFLSNQNILANFKEGVSPGTLVETMDMPTSVTDNLKSRAWSFECLSCICPGFEVLQKLLVSHVHLPYIYGPLAALLLGKSDFQIPAGQVDVDMILQSLIDRCCDETDGVQLCTDAACVLLELIRVILTKPVTGTADGWEVQYPGSVMQFLCLVHSLFPQDPLWTAPDFLSSLASAVFPFETPESSAGVQATMESSDVGEPLLFCHSHPGRKQVCDFIRILLMDSLINISAKDGLHPLIQLLEFSPDGVCQEHRQSFQTELLEFMMDIIHMTGQEEGQSTHVARDDPSMSKQEGKAAILVENVAFFSKKLVEKLYTGMFVVDPENLLVFIAEQIAVALERGQSHREMTVSVLYKSLNRALLYFLSRPRQTPAEQELIIQTLHVLEQHWDVIMATYNANVHFISCLMHCLLLIRSGSFSEGFGCEIHKKPSRNIWRHLFPHKNSRVMSQINVSDSAEVESELMMLVESTWRKVMQERRQALEEAYKIDLSAKPTGKEGQVSMGDVSPLWEEMATKAWQLFIDSQKRVINGHQKRAGLLSSALQSVQRRFGKDSVSSSEGFVSVMEAHRRTCETIFDGMLRSHAQMIRSENERMAIQWLRIEEDLLRERGLFGPGPGVFLKRGWVQNTAEGRNRTRSRIRRKQLHRSKKIPALTSGLIQKNLVEEGMGVTEVVEADLDPRILCEASHEVEEQSGLTFFPVLNEVSLLSEDFSEQCMDTQLILQELVPNEEVKAKHCVVVVSGHVVTEGVLLFGKADLYICEGFTLTSTGDLCCRIHHRTNVRDSYICNMMNKEKSSVSTSCKRWSYDDIKETSFMRFLLEDNALEIFLKNGTSVFLVFFNNDHVNAYKRLCSVVSSLKGRGVSETVLNASRSALFFIGNLRKSAAAEKTVLMKWQRGEITNFEYLMHLNTLAGRTYNDLMQYPVFPWIIADYESENLDLSSPATFRDLSKPMGAQTEKRKEKFIQRYLEVENNDGDLSAQCHYCTHYSSAIIVASYLVRMEPFSQTFICLQGGSFDVPERMFYSIQKEWESASKDNMSDVRELIPEFFYLPDFLVNSNDFDFGCMQDGTPLGDVVLPPWAKGDPQEFIRIHREALESDYVSARLHLWIDLIFGYRQQGQSAVEALNSFHPYFYTDKHNTESMKDPVIKSTILGYINNFGQMPKQLFTKPHPSRTSHKSSAGKETSVSSQITPFFFKLDKLQPSAQPIKELSSGPVGQIVCREKDVLVVEKNKLLIPPQRNTYFSWGSYDQTCSFGNYTSEKSFGVCESLSDWEETVCATCPNSCTIITAGSSTVVCVWDVSISKEKLKHMTLKQTLYGHTDTVTCLAASEAHSVIISGSLDETCILWDLEELGYITQLLEHSSAVSALAINDLTGEIVSCAGTHLYLWTMKGQLLTSINTSCGPEGNILCCCFTQKSEWDPHNVIITGCADGIVRIWKTQYTRVQLPGLEESSVSQGHVLSSAPEEADSSLRKWERHLVLCRELNRNQATSRRRCKNNPAVTALGISRTHGTLLVGDAWGRVYGWTCES